MTRNRFGITAPPAEMVSWQPKMISSGTRRRSARAYAGAAMTAGPAAGPGAGATANVPAFRAAGANRATAGALRFRERRAALGTGIPTAPAYAGETLKI